VTQGLHRYHESGQSHFITFSCYRREARFRSAAVYELFLTCLEDTRCRFGLCIYGYVVMPEHVHLLMNEPERGTLAQAMHRLKLSFAKRVRALRPTFECGPFWQPRYHDRNVRDAREFTTKLRYLHRNPVKRRLAPDPAAWEWSSFRHYALREIGPVEIESAWTARDRETRERGGPPRIFLNPG